MVNVIIKISTHSTPRQMKKYSVLIALQLLLCFPLVYAQQKYSPEIENRIKQVENGLAGPVRLEGDSTLNLKERMAFFKIPAVSIAVVRDYKIEWARAYGWADEAEKRPATTETLFQAASLSKSLNGVGILKLA